jgi:DNA polymerase III alpha subunit
MVNLIRPHQTKTGRMMAWVTLEDMTGTIELVLFPRTWEKHQFALEIGGVIMAEGKVDANSNPAKVLVENIHSQIKLGLTGFEDPLPSQIPLQPQAGSTHPEKPSSGQKKLPELKASPKALQNFRTGHAGRVGLGIDAAPA